MWMTRPVFHRLGMSKSTWIDSAFSTLAHWRVISATVCQLSIRPSADAIGMYTDDLTVRCCQGWFHLGFVLQTDPTCRMVALGLQRLQARECFHFVPPSPLLPLQQLAKRIACGFSFSFFHPDDCASCLRYSGLLVLPQVHP